MPITHYQESLLSKGMGNSEHKHWQLLNEDLTLPLATVYQSRIENNLQWMQRFADHYQIKLAPHGKTTMMPALFKQQIAAGAWAITLATVAQVSAAYLNGIKRIIMANQLIGQQNMRVISELLLNGDLEFYCLVDSVENIQQLARFFATTGLTINLLIEIGVDGGRCGCRNKAQLNELIVEITKHNCLALTGIEVYEGVIHGDNSEQLIRQFLQNVIAITTDLLLSGHFDSQQVILTGAGSAWYDVVAETFCEANLDPRIIAVIRPGCYLIHDTGIYLEAQNAVIKRNAVACNAKGDLQSALEVWAYVQSIPEPGHIIIGMGKRDVAFDAGLPIAELHYRPESKGPTEADKNWQVTHIMDQHAYMACPIDADIKVGDMIAFSTSHPCLTFDKWKHIALVDDQYNVIEMMPTYF